MVDQDAVIHNFIDNLSDVECIDKGDEGSFDEGILAFFYVFFSIFCPKKAILYLATFTVFFQFFPLDTCF